MVKAVSVLSSEIPKIKHIQVNSMPTGYTLSGFNAIFAEMLNLIQTETNTVEPTRRKGSYIPEEKALFTEPKIVGDKTEVDKNTKTSVPAQNEDKDEEEPAHTKEIMQDIEQLDIPVPIQSSPVAPQKVVPTEQGETEIPIVQIPMMDTQKEESTGDAMAPILDVVVEKNTEKSILSDSQSASLEISTAGFVGSTNDSADNVPLVQAETSGGNVTNLVGNFTKMKEEDKKSEIFTEQGFQGQSMQDLQCPLKIPKDSAGAVNHVENPETVSGLLSKVPVSPSKGATQESLYVDVTNVGKGNNDLGVDKLKNVQENGGNVVQFVTHQYETLTAKPEFLGVYESVSLPLAGQGNVQVQMVQSESQPSFNFNADTNEALFTITDAKGAKNVGNFARAVAENECLEQVDRAEFIQRLVKAAKLAQLQGHSALKMTLTPPNMGNLRVELVMKGKVLHTSFEVESQSTKELVVSNLGNLKEALQSEGINIGRFDVLMRDGYQGTTEGDTSAENQDFGSNSSYFASEDKSNQTMQDRKNHSAGIGLQLVDLFA